MYYKSFCWNHILLKLCNVTIHAIVLHTYVAGKACAVIILLYCCYVLFVTGFEKAWLPRTQQQDTLFTIARQLYTLTNKSGRYQC